MRSLAKEHDSVGYALLGLVSTAISDTPPRGFESALASTSAEELAWSAQHNQVHTAIGPVLNRHPQLAEALPDDLCLFFDAMYLANRERHSQGLKQLREIGEAFKRIDVSAVVLKGGADLLSPLHSDQAQRFVGDLDILVSPDRAEEAFECLSGIGANDYDGQLQAPGQDLERFAKHHLPKLTHAGWPFPVELHFKVGSGVIASLLPTDEVLRSRQPCSVAALSVPTLENRA